MSKSLKVNRVKLGTHIIPYTILTHKTDLVKISQNNQLLSVTKTSQYIHIINCTSCNKDADGFCSSH